MARFPRALLPACVRAFTRKKFAHVILVRGTVTTHGSYWDGGSRDEFAWVRLSGGMVTRPAVPTSPFHGGPRTDITPAPGWVLVEYGTFCGKPATIRVHVHPEDLVAFVQEPALLPGTPAYMLADWLRDTGQDELAGLVQQLSA
jgi:hypothetical protein